MTFSEMTEARYSVKKFSEKNVEEEKLKKILEVAGKAPTARNAQCIRIYVLKTDDAIAKARELTPCIYGAPLCLMFSYNIDEAYPYPGETNRNSGDEDCAIVATHVMLEASELGLGTCWVNNFSPSKAKSIFNLPENETVVLLMPLGYASPDAKPLAKHFEKKAIDEIVTVL